MHISSVTEELIDLGLGDKIVNWSACGKQNVTHFSLTLDDEEEPSLDIEDKGQVVNSDTIKSIWIRNCYYLMYYTGGPPERQYQEFFHVYLDDFLKSSFVFFENIFIFNKPENGEIMNKPYQYMRAKKMGFLQPQTVISNDSYAVTKYFCDKLGHEDILFKQMDRLRRKLPFAVTLEREVIEKNAAEIKEVPNCWQEFCPKDVEFRTTIVNGIVYHNRMESCHKAATKVDFRAGQTDPDIHFLDEADDNLKVLMQRFLSEWDLEGGVFDLLRDKEGNYWFLEVNSNGQWLFHTIFTGAKVCREMALYLSEGKRKSII